MVIERGRFESIARNERICKNCEQNMTENDYHFLFVTNLEFDDLMSKKSLDRWQSKTLIQPTSVNKKSFETEFSVVICVLCFYGNRKHCF